MPGEINPFNNFPGEFNPIPKINIKKNKPCTDKCRVQCPVSTSTSTSTSMTQPTYLTYSKETFGNVESYDSGTDYYSLLN